LRQPYPRWGWGRLRFLCITGNPYPGNTTQSQPGRHSGGAKPLERYQKRGFLQSPEKHHSSGTAPGQDFLSVMVLSVMDIPFFNELKAVIQTISYPDRSRNNDRPHLIFCQPHGPGKLKKSPIFLRADHDKKASGMTFLFFHFSKILFLLLFRSPDAIIGSLQSKNPRNGAGWAEAPFFVECTGR